MLKVSCVYSSTIWPQLVMQVWTGGCHPPPVEGRSGHMGSEMGPRSSPGATSYRLLIVTTFMYFVFYKILFKVQNINGKAKISSNSTVFTVLQVIQKSHFVHTAPASFAVGVLLARFPALPHSIVGWRWLRWDKPTPHTPFMRTSPDIQRPFPDLCIQA